MTDHKNIKMAHKKGAGSSRNGRESHSKRLGIKIFGGQPAIAGNIIVRQRGTKHNPGLNVGIGRDHTLFALIAGNVVFKKKADNRSYVSVLPFETEDVAEIVPLVPVLKVDKAKAPVKKNIITEDAPVAEIVEKEPEILVAQAPKVKKTASSKTDKSADKE